jgi:hypothetical protein
VTTVELEPITIERIDEEEDHDHENKFCHLYRSDLFSLGMFVPRAICGFPESQDWHSRLKHTGPWQKGTMACPQCGAPICMDCLLRLT